MVPGFEDQLTPNREPAARATRNRKRGSGCGRCARGWNSRSCLDDTALLPNRISHRHSHRRSPSIGRSSGAKTDCLGSTVARSLPFGTSSQGGSFSGVLLNGLHVHIVISKRQEGEVLPGKTFLQPCTRRPFMVRTWLRECCRQTEAEVVSNSSDKFHKTA